MKTKSKGYGILLYLLRRCYFLLAFLLVSMQIQAQEEKLDTLISLSIEQLMDIPVYSATRKDLSWKDSPSTVLIITEQMIKDRGYHSLEEILHDVPGFDFDKAFGVEYSTIFMRGLRTANTDGFILLFDGIIENDIWKGSAWITRQYPVTNIKQIEILYGAASALWGTNAFSGIVNVITKEGSEAGQVNLTVSGGSYARKNVELVSGNKINENVSYDFSLKYFEQPQLHPWEFMKLDYQRDFSKTFRDSFSEPMLSLDNRLQPMKLNEEYPNVDYAFHGNVYLGKNLKITYLDWTKNETQGYWYNPFLRNGKYNEWIIHYKTLKLSHTKELSEKVTLRSDFWYRTHSVKDSRDIEMHYYSREDTSDLYNTSGIRSNDVSTYKVKYDPVKGMGKVNWFNLNVWDMRLAEQLDYQVSENINLIAGANITYTNTQEDYNTGSTKAGINYSPRQLRNRYVGYLQGIVSPLSWLSFVVGGRFDQSVYEIGGGYRVFVPRVSTIFKINSDFNLRLQYSEAFREPTDFQRFATDFNVRPYPSPNLKPEKLQSVEFGSFYNFRQKILFSAAAYYNNVTGFISPNPNFDIKNLPAGTPFWVNDNGHDMHIYGYEINFDAPLLTWLTLNGNVSGAFNYKPAPKIDANYKVVKDANGVIQYDDKVLFGDIAPVKVNAGFLFKWQKFSAYVKSSYVSAKSTINTRVDPSKNPVVHKVNAYNILGANIIYRGVVKGLNLTFNIDNILNTKYYNPGVRSANGYSYNAQVLQPGINFMTGFTYNF